MPEHNYSIDEWKEAVSILSKALNNARNPVDRAFDYALIGSGAYVMHGIKYDDPNDYPADIDITITHMDVLRATIKSLEASGQVTVKVDPSSSLAVNKFIMTFKNGKSIDCEFTLMEDFGFRSASLVNINNVRVTSLIDTLQSIFLRPEHRIKDYIAFRDLIKNNLNDIPRLLAEHGFVNEDFRKAVTTMVTLLSNPETANRPEVIDGTVANLLPRLVLKKQTTATVNRSATLNTVNSAPVSHPITGTANTLFSRNARVATSPPMSQEMRTAHATESIPTRSPAAPQKPGAARAPTPPEPSSGPGKTRPLSPDERREARLKKLREAEEGIKETGTFVTKSPVRR